MAANVVNKKNVLNYIQNNSINAILFFSPSSVDYFSEIFGKKMITEIKNKSIAIAAIGATTAKAIEAVDLSVHILPKKSTEENLLEALVAL